MKQAIHSGLIGVNCGSKDPNVAHWTFDMRSVTCRGCRAALSKWGDDLESERARVDAELDAKLCAARAEQRGEYHLNADRNLPPEAEAAIVTIAQEAYRLLKTSQSMPPKEPK